MQHNVTVPKSIFKITNSKVMFIFVFFINAVCPHFSEDFEKNTEDILVPELFISLALDSGSPVVSVHYLLLQL